MQSIRTLINNNKKIIVGFVVVFVLFMVWNTFLKDAPRPTFTNEAGRAADSEIGREIVSTLSKLNTVNINTDVLDNAVFRQLRDFSQPLPGNLPVSKVNPFVPEIPNNNTPTTQDSSSEASLETRAGGENDAPVNNTPTNNNAPLEAEADPSAGAQTQ
jgi:hypothetical protein